MVGGPLKVASQHTPSLLCICNDDRLHQGGEIRRQVEVGAEAAEQDLRLLDRALLQPDLLTAVGSEILVGVLEARETGRLPARLPGTGAARRIGDLDPESRLVVEAQLVAGAGERLAVVGEGRPGAA